MSNWFNKKRTAGIVTVVMAAALLLSGTFAYVLNDQHRDAYAKGGNQIFSLILNSEFQNASYQETDWEKDQALNGPTWVNSMNHTADETYTDAFVALHLTEYLNVFTRGDWLTVGDVTTGTASGDRALFAVENGAYMTYAAALAKYNNGANIVKYVEKDSAGVATGNEYAMINGSQTQANANAALGIHGTPMRNTGDKYEYNAANKSKFMDLRNGATGVPYHTGCDMGNIDGWKATATKSVRDYVSLDFGTGTVAYADWVAAGKNEGDFWVLGDDGWAFYAQKLSPNAATEKLINSITLKKEVTNVDYQLHMDILASSSGDFEDIFGTTTGKFTGKINGTDAVTDYKVPVMTSMPALYNMLKELAGMALTSDDEMAERIGEAYPDGLPPDWEISESNGSPALVDDEGNVVLDTVNFPDTELLNLLMTGFDTAEIVLSTPGDYSSATTTVSYRQEALGNGSVITPAEMGLVEKLILNNYIWNGTSSETGTLNISSLKGIELFPNLEFLQINKNSNITSIDVSSNSKMKWLAAGATNISSINISNSPDLEYLQLNMNPNLSSVDVSNNKKLQKLVVSECSINTLDVSGLPQLEDIIAGQNPNLSSIILTGCTSLKSLTLQNCPNLTNIDASNCSALTTLWAYGSTTTPMNLDWIDIRGTSIANESTDFRFLRNGVVEILCNSGLNFSDSFFHLTDNNVTISH